jgi:signal peptidase I
MGDHRSASADSRMHASDQYGGTVGVDDVIGKAAVIVWPVSRFGLLDSPDIQGTEAAAVGPSGVDASRVTASSVAPWAIGLGAALPITAWLRQRRLTDD